MKQTFNAGAEDEARIDTAGQAIVISKIYGPLGADDIRVRLDVGKAEWVIERDGYKDRQATWIEVARFDCQIGYEEHET